MHYSLVLLIISLSAVVASPTKDESGIQNPVESLGDFSSCFPPQPTFLLFVSAKSRVAFMKIYNDKSLSKSETNERIEEWTKGESDKVQSSVSDWLSLVSEKAAEKEQGVNEVLNTVRTAVEEILAVDRDENLPKKDQDTKKIQILKKLSPKIALIVTQVMLSAECRPLSTDTTASQQ